MLKSKHPGGDEHEMLDENPPTASEVVGAGGGLLEGTVNQ
jgi:hypothetical protein